MTRTIAQLRIDFMANLFICTLRIVLLPAQIPGMDHIDSEYYEVSRVSDPDALSIDSIHKTVFKR